MRLLGKCRERRGAASNRRALRKMTGDDERRLLCAADNSALSAVRRATGHDELSAVERAQKARPSKKRLWRNVSAPDLIPARKKLIGMKRRVFERCKRVGHSMIAMDADGVAVPWTYVRGSGLSGVRLYEAENGMGKRLACHSHKQPKGAVAGTHEDSLAASASHPANEFWANDELPDPTVRPLSLAEKTVLKSSTLDNADGTGAEVIVAVEFDIAEATASSIASRTKRCTVEDLLNDSAAWSLGSEGRPTQGTATTLFTLNLSESWLVAARAEILPVLYILGGEHHVHSSLGARFEQLVKHAVSAPYDVPVHVTIEKSDNKVPSEQEVPEEQEEPDSATQEPAEQSLYSWTGPMLVRIVGDIAMIDHLMGLTGGSDASRCPYWWPCSLSTFFSMCAHADTPGLPRAV